MIVIFLTVTNLATDQVNEFKEQQMNKMMEHIGATMDDFDSCKCPSVR